MNRLSIFVTVAYSLLVFIGGLIGLIKAQSYASFIMGTSFALILAFSAFAMWKEVSWGFYGSFIAAAFLFLFFGYRFYQSFVLMPAGLMVLLSAIVLITLAFEKIFQHK